ncbi:MULTISPECIES: Na/Pi cotransporter family protein [unclassified Granulicatella]|uniref:Na/Pi cotransporter family protein n=1 Tax=unclassified Granulicatella TaxID=2630493 RepID=UPI001073467B|nr:MULTISPECIES: Na/Pi cotransporter family protein [unclassified Granulicatella]MBF0780131.1 Na/Pi cotransporter family protein [Granulicatella sp. 19428wC4_WM01]TFU95797.1 Na/Pi cotransporter family protein [Granulicatella sp. WM01]
MSIEMLLSAIAGLALFLYGMNLMAAGLQKVAGDKLKGIIQKLTRTKFMAVIVGMFVTMIIQSSSATSVMVVSFVNAGLMSLQQAIGIIFGANIGTTITGQLVSLNLTQLAPIAIASGIIMKSVTKKMSLKDASDILIGFGILFIGMNYLKDSLSPLKESPVFVDWILKYGSNPLIGLAIGLIMTFVLQSSSATIGVLIALAANGILPLSTAIYIIFGDNIGTCTTALISSLGTSRKGKRVALIHLSFNIIGTIYFMLFLTSTLTAVVEHATPNDIARQIANAHSLFNIVNVIVLFPFSTLLLKLVYWILPITPEENAMDAQKNSTYLDPYLLQTPAIALNNALYEFILMSSEAEKTITSAIQAIQLKDSAAVKEAIRHEKRVNKYEKQLIEYLVELSKQETISSTELQRIDYLFNSIHDVERISDHAENIAEYAREAIEQNIVLDDTVISELNHVYELVLTGFRLAIDAMSTGNIEDINRIIDIERQIDTLKLDIRRNHVLRMNKDIATPESGVIVMDLLSNLERISDHFRNIGEAVDKTGIAS